jgi:hypothetical protein
LETLIRIETGRTETHLRCAENDPLPEKEFT